MGIVLLPSPISLCSVEQSFPTFGPIFCWIFRVCFSLKPSKIWLRERLALRQDSFSYDHGGWQQGRQLAEDVGQDAEDVGVVADNLCDTFSCHLNVGIVKKKYFLAFG